MNGITSRQSHHLSIVWAKPSKSTANRFCCLPLVLLSSLVPALLSAHPLLHFRTQTLRTNPLRVPTKESIASVDLPCSTSNPRSLSFSSQATSFETGSRFLTSLLSSRQCPLCRIYICLPYGERRNS